MGPQTRAWPPQRILPKAVLLGSSAETKFSSFELFAARIVSGEYHLGGTIMIQVRPPICPYCRQQAVPHRLKSSFSAVCLPLLTLQSHHDKAAAATRSRPFPRSRRRSGRPWTQLTADQIASASQARRRPARSPTRCRSSRPTAADHMLTSAPQPELLHVPSPFLPLAQVHNLRIITFRTLNPICRVFRHFKPPTVFFFG